MTFEFSGVQFAEQYFHIYNARLESVRPQLIANSRYRWGDSVKHVPIEELSASLGNTEVFIIGTLFKVMPKQPSILKDEKRLITFDPNENFTSDEDTIVLHEVDENVTIVGDINPHEHVTGIPVSLLGKQTEGGAKFVVSDICYAGPSLSVYKELNGASQESNCENSDRLLLISGLEFGFDSHCTKEQVSTVVAAMKKLLRYVVGEATGDEMNGFLKNKITRIIIAGNSIAPGFAKAKAQLAGIEQKNDKSEFGLVELVKMFDDYLFNLAQGGATIDLMPGRNDPTTYLLPQQPFHPKVIPKSGMLENVKPVTNPCQFKIKNASNKEIELLGMSGGALDAIRQNSRIEHATTILKSIIEWGHLAPNAPDNVSCIPFKSNDPFVLKQLFDIYFAGNQTEYLVTTYCTETKPKIQLVSVPSFVKTQSCVMVNLESLECKLVKF